MSDNLKKLTGKNPADYEPVVYNLINNPDAELFAQLVEKDDFLYDFIKENVVKRMAKVCNEKNFCNLLQFLKYYSPSYEGFIVSTLAKFADEDLTDKMLEIFENGTDAEKTYCAKFFSYIQDPLALELLKEYALSQNVSLSSNCISTLALFGDREIFNQALDMLNSKDEFEVLEGARILVSYGDKSAVDKIIQVMKNSPLAEHIASELLYLCDLKELISKDYATGLYVLNLIINGLGETVALSQVFDFALYDVLADLSENDINSKSAVVLLNAKEKFETLTENDEYLFDESKDVKQEIFDIKKLLKSVNKDKCLSLIDNELKSESLFVYSALDYSKNSAKIRELLHCTNQTVILKAVEVLKSFKILTQQDKDIALRNISDENIRNIILAV